MAKRKFVRPPEEVVRLCHKLGIEKACLYIPAISRYRGKYKDMTEDIYKWMHIQYIYYNVHWNKRNTARDSRQIRFVVAKKSKNPIAYKLVNRAKERWKNMKDGKKQKV